MPPQMHEIPREDASSDNGTDVRIGPFPTVEINLEETSHLLYPRESFIAEFAKSKGPPQIVVMMILLAFGFGSTVGVVPAVVSDRFARINHGYNGNQDCSSYATTDKPQECLDGSADAQNSAALASLISNALTFFTSSLMGSLSDEYGRRGIMILGVTISSLSPLMLLLLQCQPEMSPAWYYFTGAISGLVSWVAVSLSALSDVMPARWRAPSFGMVLAGLMLGFSFAPLLALMLGHFNVSILSLTAVWSGLFTIVFFFPETVSVETAIEARAVREAQIEGLEGLRKLAWYIYRPMWELSILNRNRLFRLLSCLAFCSGMVASGDQTLLVYYIEERLNFKDKDIATMYLVSGLLGIFVQGVILKFINDCLGERKVVMVAYTFGSVVNLLYALAFKKSMIFIAVAMSAFVGMAFPTISAIKSNNVEPSEQGRIQGALYSLSALAMAVGPTAMRFVYYFTKDGAFLGPGSMFVLASGLYLLAVYCAYLLPAEADSRSRHPQGYENARDDQHQSNVETPLLNQTNR